MSVTEFITKYPEWVEARSSEVRGWIADRQKVIADDLSKKKVNPADISRVIMSDPMIEAYRKVLNNIYAVAIPTTTMIIKK